MEVEGGQSAGEVLVAARGSDNKEYKYENQRLKYVSIAIFQLGKRIHGHVNMSI